MRVTRASTSHSRVVERLSSSSGSDMTSVLTPLSKLVPPEKSKLMSSTNPTQPTQPQTQALPNPSSSHQAYTTHSSAHHPPNNSDTRSASNHKQHSDIDYNQEQQKLTDLGNQLSSELHHLATIYKTKATKYKAISSYQALEVEKRKLVATTSTMLKSETNHDTIQRIISDSNAVIFPMYLKQHYLKVHIGQIVDQEKELEVIRANLVKLHQEFVATETLITKGVQLE
ncbi:hypothetical protein KGF57_002405 [Candida theae]|uniref:Uncharacterized protein n=1 Tax=Candida theae TaxID=1198502 RepID=A0AAD5BEY0_9ASCO|nr:uncharacterized protein KGF57_002405 [Candida theae]KAI5958560.1 hypothetical protein KGF57_002405 [Candida theae]